MESGLSKTRKYLVPLITHDEGRPTAVHIYHRPDLGKVLWLFSSQERAYKFMKAMAERGEMNKAFMEVLEQSWGRYTSEDLNFARFYSAKTVPELLPMLKKNDVDYLVVDPGIEERIYKAPHKS